MIFREVRFDASDMDDAWLWERDQARKVCTSLGIDWSKVRPVFRVLHAEGEPETVQVQWFITRPPESVRVRVR